MKNIGYSAAFALAGAAAMAGQVLAARGLLAALRGNELAVGAALFFWLLMVGASSLLGGRFAVRLARPGAALGWCLAALSVAAPAMVAAPRVLMPLMGYSGSEVVSASGMVFVTAATLVLAAPLAGLTFPLAAASAGGGGEGPARAYMFESLGGAAGGLFVTIIAAPYLTPLQGASAASLACAAGAVIMSREGEERGLITAAALCAALSVAVFAAAPRLELAAMNLTPHGGGNVVDARWSRYGELAVVALPGQHAVYEDGRFSLSVPDPDTAQGQAHLAMLVHRSPGRVLLVGGGMEAAAEMLKHNPARLDYVEPDPELIDALSGYIKGDTHAALSDPRLFIHHMDGRRFVKTAIDSYDLVVVSVAEPSTAAVNRYYTLEFFREAARILAPGGVFVTGLPSSPNYIGRAQLMLNGTIYRTLAAVFPFVRVSPGETNRFFASMEPDAVSFDPRELAARYGARGIRASAFDASTPAYMLLPGNVAYVETRLAGSPGPDINTDERPVAYIYSLALWGEVAGFRAVERLSGPAGSVQVPPWAGLACAIVMGALIALYLRERPAPAAGLVIATTGFSGITIELAVLLSFQSQYGYLYELMGLLMALFMLGLYAGSRWGARVAAPGYVHVRLLIMMEAGLALNALALSRMDMLHGYAAPGAAAGFVMLAAGVWTGMEYPVALAVAGEQRPGREHYAGLYYGLDLIGSAAGALFCGLVFVPLMGIAQTAVLVVLLKVMTAVALTGMYRARLRQPPL